MATTTYGTPYVSGTDLVANWPAASLTVANSIDAAGYYIGRGINAQTASYTGVLTDAGKTVTMTNASANTFTVPANSSVAYPTGTRINILNLGAGACTPTAGAGVTISGTIAALATNEGAAVVKTATNTWSYLPFTSGTPTLTSADVTSTTGLAGGYPQTSGIYTIYVWNGSGTIVLGKAGLCDALVVGGGGGGAVAGAGAGGINTSATAYLIAATHTIIVGAGGAAASASNFIGGNGTASQINGIAGIGGGAGGRETTSGFGINGGSGGGAGVAITGGGAGTTNQGNNGGNGSSNAAGGGGGANAVGANASAHTGGAGGAGLASSITGSSVTYAGGGGGGALTTQGAGGAGGGASAGNPSTAGTVNTGGGGGGNFTNGYGGAGGSGVVIIRVVT